MDTSLPCVTSRTRRIEKHCCNNSILSINRLYNIKFTTLEIHLITNKKIISNHTSIISIESFFKIKLFTIYDIRAYVKKNHRKGSNFIEYKLPWEAFRQETHLSYVVGFTIRELDGLLKHEGAISETLLIPNRYISTEIICLG